MESQSGPILSHANGRRTALRAVRLKDSALTTGAADIRPVYLPEDHGQEAVMADHQAAVVQHKLALQG
jgi:hypothetical protein